MRFAKRPLEHQTGGLQGEKKKSSPRKQAAYEAGGYGGKVMGGVKKPGQKSPDGIKTVGS